MSRNLCTNECYYCGGEPELVEKPHNITEKESHVYYKEYEGMIVAKAVCPYCEAQYLAWLDLRYRKHYAREKVYDGVIQDLSFYSTFNDEPGESDLPKWKVESKVVYTRVGKFGE